MNNSIEPTSNFCRCLNCDVVMFDENPQVDAKEYGNSEFPDAVWMDRDEDGYLCCPNCMTDEHLQDI